MKDWKLALFSGLSQACGMEDIIDTAAKAVHHRGFDYCGWKILLPHSSGKTVVLTVASAEEEAYAKIIDEKTLASVTQANLWSGIAKEVLDANAPALIDDHTQSTFHCRWMHAAQDSRTNAYSLFYAVSIAAMSQEELHQVSADMQWVAAAIHANMFYMPMRQKHTLTIREKTILALISEDKVLEEIAEQLRLSLATTEFHLESAEYKLQTPDAKQAAAKALFFGLLI